MTRPHRCKPVRAGKSPRGPDSVQRCLRARVGKPDKVEAGYPLAKQLGEADLMLVGGVVGHSFPQLLLDYLHHRWRGMSQYQSGHGVDEIQPVHAVGVDHVASRGGCNEDGVRLPEDGVAAVTAG